MEKKYPISEEVYNIYPALQGKELIYTLGDNAVRVKAVLEGGAE